MPTSPFARDLTGDAWLELEGIRAARSGLTWKANPYLHRDNMPAASGDSLKEWARKHDAWQRGFERQFEADPSDGVRNKYDIG